MTHVRKDDIIEVHFTVEPELHGMRVDHFLKKKIERLSRTRIQRIIETQLVGPGGRRMKAHSPVAAGDHLVIMRPAKPEPDAPKEFGVVFEDDALLVVDKPALLTMHPSAKYHFNTLTQLLADRYPGQRLYTTHRLDRETSGIVICAKSADVAAKMKMHFERRRVKKTYLAITSAAPAEESGLINEPIGLASAAKIAIRMIPTPLDQGGLSAETAWRVRERRGAHALLEVSPLTGRQHQIRAHLSLQGWPIVGDKLYGPGGDEAFTKYWETGWTDDLRALFILDRHALHAGAITLPHPTTGADLTLATPLPQDLQTYWDTLGTI